MIPPKVFSPSRVQLLALLAASVLVVGACSDAGTTGGGEREDVASTSTTAAGDETASAPKDEVLLEIEDRGAPDVEVPDEPASELGIEDLVDGTGDEVGAGATITAHYTGVGQSSGQTFDSSWDRGEPATFSLSQVIPGWTEGLVGMKVGGRRRLVIPGELAYGESPPSGDIGANETLVFVIDLVRIDDAGPSIDADAMAAVEERGAPDVMVPDPLPTELEITDEVEGSGDEVAAGAGVTVAYTGVSASTGDVFDSSWDRGQPVSFTLDQVIPGWGEGLVGMKIGGRRQLVIPPEQAYGDNPPSDDIAPGETLVFVVDLVGID